MTDDIMASLNAVKKASRELVDFSDDQINQVLLALADAIPEHMENLLAANQDDLQRMSPDDPKYDRLLLDASRLLAIADDIRNVATLDSPLGKVLEGHTLANGIALSKVSVPLGVIGIIYEARPNVTFDVFSLCLKSGNAVALKGGSDAARSNQAAVALIHKVLKNCGVSPDVIYLLPPERAAVKFILEAVDQVDLIIPRGSRGLIDFVREHAKVPVIETGAGIVHTYVDDEADINMARDIIFNAKTRRVSVCNALDALIIHEKQLANLVNMLAPLAEQKVEVLADAPAYAALKNHYPEALLKPAQESDFGVEFLSLKMVVKTVTSLEEAVAHITRYSSKHSEAIVSSNQAHIDYFIKHVDAAVVYANASTAFTDGAQFGLGAEIGISTQKLHARGPMALQELTSYKWIAMGSGQTRPA